MSGMGAALSAFAHARKLDTAPNRRTRAITRGQRRRRRSPPYDDKSRRAGEEMRAQHLAPGAPGVQVECVDDGETKAAGRHGVALGFLVLVKRDLHARNAGHLPHLAGARPWGVAIARPLRPEQPPAVSVAPVVIGKTPSPLPVESHERVAPAGPIEVRPLIAHAQMPLDHATADGL